MENFEELLYEQICPESGINMKLAGTLLGMCHKKMHRLNETSNGIIDFVEIMIEMAVKMDTFEDYSSAIVDACLEYLGEDIDFEDWTVYDTYVLRESEPWCVDEDGFIIEEELIADDMMFEPEEPEEIMNAASKKQLLKAAKNPKSAKTFTVNKKYDKRAGLSKEQIKAGMIRCAPGTPAEGKIRKKGNCSKRTDPALSRKMKQAAMKNKASRRAGARKAAKTKKRLAGRRRSE